MGIEEGKISEVLLRGFVKKFLYLQNITQISWKNEVSAHTDEITQKNEKFRGDLMLEICIKEVPLSGIKTPEQLAAFILQSLGLSDLRDERDVKFLLAFIKHREGLKADELQKICGLGQTATYARIRKFVNAGVIYKARGGVYRLRERTLKDTLDFRVRREIERVFSSIVDVAEELEKKVMEAKK